MQVQLRALSSQASTSKLEQFFDIFHIRIVIETKKLMLQIHHV